LACPLKQGSAGVEGIDFVNCASSLQAATHHHQPISFMFQLEKEKEKRKTGFSRSLRSPFDHRKDVEYS
jgi:radical SAM superfamily enzyme